MYTRDMIISHHIPDLFTPRIFAPSCRVPDFPRTYVLSTVDTIHESDAPAM